MASYAGSGTERGRGGGGAGQVGFSGADRSGVSRGGGDRGNGRDGLSALSPQQQQAINDAIMADIAADLAQQPAQQNVDAITGFAGELGLTPRETEIAMERAMRGARAVDMAQKFSLLSNLGRATGLLQDPRIAARQSMINLATMPNAGFVDGYLTAPIQGGGYVRQGGFGFNTYTGMPIKGYEGAFANLIAAKPESQADGRPQQVAPVQDPVTGQARCPEGYVFDETLQACIMDTSATSPFSPTSPNYIPPYTPPPTSSYFANQGLLGTPPSGILGTASDPYSYLRPYTQQQGYTLLS